jgi:hypothetical protein
VNSEWVLEEADTGKRRNILLPIYLDDLSRPLGFGTVQGVTLVGWNGNHKDEGYLTLINAVSDLLGTAHQPVPTIPAPSGQRYRLPSEAEWEYAARAGTATRYYWGNEIGKDNANCRECSSEREGNQTAPVGSYAPNAFGLYDMLGNVLEWTADCYHDNYQGAPDNGTAWTTGNCAYRMLRGGSWFNSPEILRSSFRIKYKRTVADVDLGFRLARDIN